MSREDEIITHGKFYHPSYNYKTKYRSGAETRVPVMLRNLYTSLSTTVEQRNASEEK